MNVERFDPTETFTPDELASVRERSDLTGLMCIAHAWVVIAASMALYWLWPNPLTFIAAVILIGSRQLGLAILMHDAAHGVLLRSKIWNDPVSQWLCAFPVFTDTIPYRHYHLVHHRKTQQKDDPDLHLSAKFPDHQGKLPAQADPRHHRTDGIEAAPLSIAQRDRTEGNAVCGPRAEFLEAAGQTVYREFHFARDPHGTRQAALLFHVLAVAAADMAATHHARSQHRRARDGARRQRRDEAMRARPMQAGGCAR